MFAFKRFLFADRSARMLCALPMVVVAISSYHCIRKPFSSSSTKAENSRESAPSSTQDLRASIISVADDYLKLFAAAGMPELENSLKGEISRIKNGPAIEPKLPEKAIGFFPKISDTQTNPYLTALYQKAEIFLKAEDRCYPLSTKTLSIFPIKSFSETRLLGQEIEQLYFLVASPDSRYHYHPRLARILFCKIYASAYDYYLHGGQGLTIPGSTPNALDDWFVTGPVIYGWRMVDESFGFLIPETFRTFMTESARKAADAVSQVATTPRYANRDISYAEILLQAGLYLKSQPFLDKFTTLLQQTCDSVFPDGAFPYIWDQNESVGYHGGNIRSIARIYASTGNKTASACLAKLSNFTTLSIEPGNISEFYSSPAWKTMWNGSSGIEAAEPVAFFAKNPYLRLMIDQWNQINGALASPLNASMYDKNLQGKKQPDNYIVFDRNIEGPRGRSGFFSFGVTGRLLQKDNKNDPGQKTLAGAMITEEASEGEGRRINSILMAVYPKVHVKPGNTQLEWNNWAYLRSQLRASTALTKEAAAFGSIARLQTQSSGPTAKEFPWRSHEIWITLQDRLIGVVEIVPDGAAAQASEINGRIKLGYGRTGKLQPQKLSTVTEAKEYQYGQMKIILHQHNFKRIDTAIAGVVRDEYPLATEIRLSDQLQAGSTTMNTYSAANAFYFVVEIGAAKAPALTSVQFQSQGDIRSLLVSREGKTYGAYLNIGSSAQSLNLDGLKKAGGLTHIHLSNRASGTFDAILAETPTVRVEAEDLILAINSPDALDNNRGWQNFSALLEQSK